MLSTWLGRDTHDISKSLVWLDQHSCLVNKRSYALNRLCNLKQLRKLQLITTDLPHFFALCPALVMLGTRVGSDQYNIWGPCFDVARFELKLAALNCTTCHIGNKHSTHLAILYACTNNYTWTCSWPGLGEEIGQLGKAWGQGLGLCNCHNI